ncbi:NAD-dependent epimerase/dehydratase family protein [Polyangium sp. 15x6]|uniref:NAD-dependent epimerase/dehydratase family protein n=1 Tax=Polyangium sp. 15x6 TaxID=3042687 RepID=UPI002499EC93|nr:NAD-dependent epimerase/dehydratase family protein [Polyangium sp. 15x6]MDI3283888.1 NAD-dependent epimerase/dehydratase family protein [Polyangium sp. 15x6]
MRILVLGGTAFLGRTIVAEALGRDHHVTTFNRGRSFTDPPGVEVIRGDRTERADLERLRAGRWDAVVDTSGYVPRVVGQAAAVLREVAPVYTFASSASVYVDRPRLPVDETSRVYDCAPDAGPDDGDYGTLKAGCERAVVDHYGDAALLLRLGVIVGPYEDVGRLPWWLSRIARGGEVLAPGSPDVPMQLVDVRDVARLTVDLLERGEGGVLNVAGPPGHPTFGSLLSECAKVTESAARLVWARDDFLLAHDVKPWSELPIWAPMNAECGAAWQMAVPRAERLGLRCRPMIETIADTWALMRAGWQARPRPELPKLGIDEDKEQRILAALGSLEQPQ